jgi:hypothetical protein
MRVSGVGLAGDEESDIGLPGVEVAEISIGFSVN